MQRAGSAGHAGWPDTRGYRVRPRHDLVDRPRRRCRSAEAAAAPVARALFPSRCIGAQDELKLLLFPRQCELRCVQLLLRKARDALPSGGALIVYEAMIDDERRQNAFDLLMSLNMLIETPAGFDCTGTDCMDWMREAGFRDVRVEPLQARIRWRSVGSDNTQGDAAENEIRTTNRPARNPVTMVERTAVFCKKRPVPTHFGQVAKVQSAEP
jgi:hypothetical protein